MDKIKVAVGMSGGVDSSVAAYILKEKGYEVIGITMKVIPDYVCKGKESSDLIIRDAREVAEKLGIEHHVLDLRESFQEKVIDYFSSEYMAGRTPNPCVACNRQIKFGDLFQAAMDLGAEYIVTGHYANIEKDLETDRYILKKGDDFEKDQSYFLYNIEQEKLKHIMMPLKDYTKDQVREIAGKIGLKIADKKDSEEICFIPHENHGRFIKEELGKEIIKGEFVDTEGNILGEHEGIINYTIGQRKGLGIALGRKVYVQDILPETNRVVLGDEKGLFKSKLYADEINLISIDELPEEMTVKVKIRYAAKESEAIVKPYRDGMIVEFKEPQRAITRGQSVVMYDGDVVVGGGIVKHIY